MLITGRRPQPGLRSGRGEPACGTRRSRTSVTAVLAPEADDDTLHTGEGPPDAATPAPGRHASSTVRRTGAGRRAPGTDRTARPGRRRRVAVPVRADGRRAYRHRRCLRSRPGRAPRPRTAVTLDPSHARGVSGSFTVKQGTATGRAACAHAWTFEIAGHLRKGVGGLSWVSIGGRRTLSLLNKVSQAFRDKRWRSPRRRRRGSSGTPPSIPGSPDSDGGPVGWAGTSSSPGRRHEAGNAGRPPK